MNKRFSISDYNGIKRHIDDNGYVMSKMFTRKKNLKKLKKRLLDVLHYIHPKKITNLNKSIFKLKKDLIKTKREISLILFHMSFLF